MLKMSALNFSCQNLNFTTKVGKTMETLNLTLKTEHFNDILSGAKKEEYRDIEKA